jgi:hypothetical protein
VDGRRLHVRLRTNNDELDRIIWPVIESAVGLLTSDDVVWLKRCGECDWLFVDESKNHSRTWVRRSAAIECEHAGIIVGDEGTRTKTAETGRSDRMFVKAASAEGLALKRRRKASSADSGVKT